MAAAALRLCQLHDVQLGTARGFDPAGCGEDSMFVLRREDGVRAYANLCPHQGVRLEYKKDKFLSADGRSIECYAHGALFDPTTGDCTEGACDGQSLKRLACEVRDQWIWIEEP